jgi:hypothetical protein
MAIIYVDGVEGSDSNDGSTRALAKASISGARAALTAGVDIVLIRPTIYLEGNITFNAANDETTLFRNDTFYPGVVIIDFEERLDYQSGGFANNAYFQTTRSTTFLNLHFRNMASGACAIRGSHSAWWMLHCVFYSQNASPTGFGIGSVNTTNDMEVKCRNCSFYNLGSYAVFCQGTNSIFYNNYAPTLSVFNGDSGSTVDYNAYIGNSETNGFNTSTTDPGFRDVAQLDFRLDPTSIVADYEAFMQGGISGGRVGAFGKNGIYYFNQIPQLRFLTPDPTTAGGNPNLTWENEGPGGTNTYTDGTPGDIVEDGATFALKIDLGATPAATGGRVRSDVYDLGATGNPAFVNAVFSAFQDGPGGALIDTDTTLPQKIEYRSSPSSFAKGDVSPSWIEFETKESFSVTDRFIQFRVEFRTDHTNA